MQIVLVCSEGTSSSRGVGFAAKSPCGFRVSIVAFRTVLDDARGVVLQL